MEKEYQRIIHHASTLIVNNQYARASNILAYAYQKGYKNTEIIVMMSYCLKMTKGISQAIKYLENTQNNGPLISMALAQYYKQLNDNKNCLNNLNKIQKQNQDEANKSSLVVSIAKNMDILLNTEVKPPIYKEKYGKIDVEAINQINQVVYKLKTQKISKSEARQFFMQLSKERGLTGKLKQYVLKFTQYLKHDLSLAF